MITDQEVNFSLFMGGKRVLDKAVSQALRVDAAKVADRPPLRLCVVRTGPCMGKQSPQTECTRTA
jgi:hypothetical protein